MKKVILLLPILFLVSCSGETKSNYKDTSLNSGQSYKKYSEASKAEESTEELYDLNESGSEIQLSERKLIKTANLSYEKKDLAQERSRIHDLLDHYL